MLPGYLPTQGKRHRGLSTRIATNLQRAKMLRHCNMATAKTWSRFQVKNQRSPDIVLRIIDLTKDLYDDYVEFQMNHFVRREAAHLIAGTPNNINALSEYKTFLRNICDKPPFYSTVCCPEIEGKLVPKIVGSCTLKLLQKNKLSPQYNYVAKTSEVRKLLQIENEWNNLCPIKKIMEKYGVEYAFDYPEMTVHPDYVRLGIATEMLAIGPKLCKAFDVQLLVAWATSEGTQKAAAKNGWISEYVMKTEEVTKKYNVTLENLPPFFKFMVRRL